MTKAACGISTPNGAGAWGASPTIRSARAKRALPRNKVLCSGRAMEELEMKTDRTAIAEVVYRSCLALDEKNFKAYLDLCDGEFHYTITAHSPEIRKDMVWLDHDKAGMQSLFTNLPRHNSDHSPVTRHATVYTVEVDE